MTRVNLMPVHRRNAARRTRHIRGWAWGGAVYASVLLCAGIAIRVAWSGETEALSQHLTSVEAEIDQTKRALSALRRQLGQTSAQMQANTAVGRQPDWSVLLALLAEALEEDIVLRSCELETRGGAARSTDARTGSAGNAGHGSSPEPLLVKLNGYGRSQQAVSKFVLRLEGYPLFREIRLLDTRREPFLTHQAVAFRIDCVLETSPRREEPDAVNGKP